MKPKIQMSEILKSYLILKGFMSLNVIGIFYLVLGFSFLGMIAI
jgi:hypothetical protein